MTDKLQTILDDIFTLAEKATPGPWRAEWNGSGVNLKIGPGDGYMIGTMDTEYIGENEPIIPAEEIEANGELFAASRTLIPRLVKALVHQMEVANALQCAAASHGNAAEAWYSTKSAELLAILEGREP